MILGLWKVAYAPSLVELLSATYVSRIYSVLAPNDDSVLR